MLQIKKHIPNFITSLNIAAGSLSIIFSFEGLTAQAGYLILLAAVFDFLDGMSARMLNAYSELGKQLDSLADVISFGLAPAVIAYQIMKSAVLVDTLYLNNIEPVKLMYLFIVLLIPIFSALRLAKFNIDTRQTTSFIGMPTPANAMFFAAIPIISSVNPFDPILFALYDKNTLLVLVIVMSLLLVSPLPMFSFKFKNLKIKENWQRFVFLGLIIGLLTFCGSSRFDLLISLMQNLLFDDLLFEIFYIIVKALPFIIILYILLSLIYFLISLFNKKTNS